MNKPEFLPHKTIAPRLTELPLVSVIIVNYNYGRFLWQAVTSVVQQTYSNFECIIIDNASADESADVLTRIEETYPDTIIIRRKENSGQSSASIEGYAASSGEYIVFLDADDCLLPDCLSTHIFVHLSLRIPVGFSSGDMLQSVGQRLVLGTVTGISDYIRSGKGRTECLLRRIDQASGNIWPLPSPDDDFEADVHFVPPENVTSWAWAPTSGNCFRRDALQLFLGNKRLQDLRSCTDAYLLRGIGSLMGSVLIDRAIAVYRLHGQNVFSKSPQLNGILIYERGTPSDNDLFARRLLIDYFIDNAALFMRKLPAQQTFLHVLKRLDAIDPKLPPAIPGCHSYLASKLVLSFNPIAQAIGTRSLIMTLLSMRVPPSVIIRAYCKHWPARLMKQVN